MLEKQIRQIARIKKGISNSQDVLFAVDFGQEASESNRKTYRVYIGRQAYRNNKINAALQKHCTSKYSYQFVKNM
jgi:hypothetical protein